MTSLSKATVAMQMHHGVIACEPDASLKTVAPTDVVRALALARP